jgi:hypothetical protein
MTIGQGGKGDMVYFKLTLRCISTLDPLPAIAQGQRIGKQAHPNAHPYA